MTVSDGRPAPVGFATRGVSARGPAVLVVSLTYKCNVRCVMCSVWEREDPQSVSLQEFGRLLEDAGVRSSLEVISLTGGEPFLRGDLPEIADAVAQACPQLREVGIPTNGSMPARIAQEVERLLDTLPPTVTVAIVVSLDGTAATHDRLRGVPGLYAKTVSTVRTLADMRARQPRLSLGINMTVMPGNVRDVADVLALGDAMGVGVTLTPAVRSDLHIDSLSMTGWDGSTDEWTEVSRALRQAGARSGSTALLDACDVMDGGPRRTPCVFWSRGSFLDTDGGLYVCSVTREGRFATVREPGDLEAAWGSPAHVEALERLRAGACRTCVSNCMSTEADRDELLAQVRRDGRPVAIFGAGGGGRKVSAQLLQTGGVVDRFIDNAPSLHGQTIDGVPVVPFESGEACRGAITIVATMTGAGQVTAQLEAAGLVEGRDFVRYY